MDYFEKFIRLTDSQRNRIVKTAKTVERMTNGAISFTSVAEVCTVHQFNRNEEERAYRSSVPHAVKR